MVVPCPLISSIISKIFSTSMGARPIEGSSNMSNLGLAPMLVEKIFEIIEEINGQGTTILLVEQNANVALEIADRGYVLETGRIVLEGAAAGLLDNPQVQEAYLGGA